MIKLLTPSEQQYITKQMVIDLEEVILLGLGFNLIFMSPFQFLERFLRLTDFHEHQEIVDLAKEILLKARLRCASLEFKPSLLAASSFFLAVWSSQKLNQKTCLPLL